MEELKIVSRRDSAKVLFSAAAESVCALLLAALQTGADLSSANLSSANLRGANLSSANLSSANLRGTKMAWQAHALLSYVLFLSAGDDVQKRMIAGLVAVSVDWCWEKLLSIEHPEKEWALRALAGYITEGDEHPKVLDAYKE